jgi:dethiobiotin synthetase
VILVAPNKLGTLNHTLLTINALARIRRRELSMLLVEQRRPDLSARTNRAVLQRLLAPIEIVSMPDFGPDPLRPAALERNNSKIDRLLRQFTRIVMID